MSLNLFASRGRYREPILSARRGYGGHPAGLATIDLNPVAAGMAEAPETSRYTSIKQRVEHVDAPGQTAEVEAAGHGSVAGSHAAAGLEDSLWLCPIEDRRRLGSSRGGGLDGEPGAIGIPDPTTAPLLGLPVITTFLKLAPWQPQSRWLPESRRAATPQRKATNAAEIPKRRTLTSWRTTE
jgi:hypothetical protein